MESDPISDSIRDSLSKLIASHPPLQQSSPSSSDLLVLWSHASLLSDALERIRCAFEGIKVGKSFKGLIQLWAQETINGRQLLTTYDQPFALAKPENVPQFFEGLCEYRSSSVKYQYDVDLTGLQAEGDPAIISSNGARARAFWSEQQDPLDRALLTDMRFNETSPSVLASENGLMNMVMVPVFDPYQRACVGVVECSTRSCKERLHVLRELSFALEKQGLKTFDSQKYLSHKTICGLEVAKAEIDNALDSIWQAHQFQCTQVWIACKDEDRAAFSSSSQDTQTKGMIWLKLTGKWNTFDNDDFEFFLDYSHACDKIPLKMDKDFAAGRTLENCEPYFIENIGNLSDKKPDRLSSIWFPCSCFVIYLRSTKTPGLVYAFEFLWKERSKNVDILESLLSTLKTRLPSFIFASGTKLGDEIDILDVKRSVVGEKKYMTVPQRNKMPLQREMQPTSRTAGPSLSREQIMSPFGQPAHVVAARFGVEGINWQGHEISVTE